MAKLGRAALIASILASFGVAFVFVARVVPWPLVLMPGVLLIRRYYRGPPDLWACGTARYADDRDLRIAGLVGRSRGLILGFNEVSRTPTWLEGLNALFDPSVDSVSACDGVRKVMQGAKRRGPDGELVRLSTSVHSICFAMTGSGKSQSLAIPFLMSSPDSCVIVDFKGELARYTAESRRRRFGHRIILLDPFKVYTKTPDRYNPLDFLFWEDDESIDEIRDLAEAFVIRRGDEKEPHWSDSAELWLTALISVVVCFGEAGDRSMQTVRDRLADSAKLEVAMRLMCESDVWQGMLARLGHQLMQFKDRELASVLTTTSRFLRFLDTLAVFESTLTSSFNPHDLREGKMSVYLILPPIHARAQSPLLRMWITGLLRAVVKGEPRESRPVHFVLDESASLGRMEVLVDAVEKFRAWGVRMQFYMQSMGQLKQHYPDGADQTLLSNCTQVFFSVNDPMTAEYVSNRLGESTIAVASGGTGGGYSRQSSAAGTDSTSYSRNWNDNWSQQARRLLKIEEVMTLPERTALSFVPGLPPIRTTLIRAYEKPNLSGPSKDPERRRDATRLTFGAALMLASFTYLAVLIAASFEESLRAARPLGMPQYRPAKQAPPHPNGVGAK